MSRPGRRSFILVVIGSLFLTTMLGLFFVSRYGHPATDINTLNDRLESLDERFLKLAGQVIELQQTTSRQDDSIESLRKQMGDILKKLDRLGSGTESITGQAGSTGTFKTEPTSQPKTRYHTVRRGDTLYQIAKSHGISVDEIVGLNNLTKNQNI